MNIIVKWEIDIEVEDGTASIQQKRIAAAFVAWQVQQYPGSTATVFTCNGKSVDVGPLGDFETRRALSFNGDLWFWTLTPKETKRIIAATATRTYKQVFPKLMRRLQTLANSLDWPIALRDHDGNELTTIEPTEE